jgi:hypothetical protein
MLRIRRTNGDLTGAENIEASHVAGAIQYRSLKKRLPIPFLSPVPKYFGREVKG